MKRVFAGMAAALLAAVLFFPCKVSAVSAEKAILMDAQTQRVLYQRNASDKALIASTTKIMTALVVCEQCNVLDRMAIPKEAVGIEGSSLYLKEGEVLTIQELLYGMMLHSGNDAATALAIYCGGTVEGFVQLMNDKAHRLGLKNTHFENPHGLDGTAHYSTARDLAVLSAYAMKNPIFRQTVSTKSMKIGTRYLTNHNKLLWRVEGADGVKTGYTKAAGRILVSSAVKDGRRLVAVTINAPKDWNDHESLYAMGFRDFCLEKIVDKGETVGEFEIIGGEQDRVDVAADGEFSYPLTKDEKVSIVIQKPDFVYAPVVENTFAGYAYVCVDGAAVGKVPLVFEDTVEQQKVPKVSFFNKLFGG